MSKKYATEEAPYVPQFERTVMEKLQPKAILTKEDHSLLSEPLSKQERVNLLNQYRAVQTPKHTPILPKWVITLQKLFIQLLKHAGFKEENPSDRKY
jgi:hypothetical protein